MAPIAPRPITDPPRRPDGLFVQPTDVSPARELVENHNRQRFASHFKYADIYCGNTRTWDPQGRYNCGRCNMLYDGDGCLLLKVPRVDTEAGSCGDWEDTDSGDPEMVLHEKSIEGAGYDVAENGVGWGCHRCPFSSPAVAPDSRGRTLYCGKGDFRVFPTACCVINGAKSFPLDRNGQPIRAESLLRKVRRA